MMVSSHDFSASLHSALSFLMNIDSKEDSDSRAPSFQEPNTSHGQNIARVILSSLLSRCKKLKNMFSPDRYDTVSWFNILPLLNYIKSFTFETANWTSVSPLKESPHRLSIRLTSFCVKKPVLEDNLHICPLYRFSNALRPAKISSKFGFKVSLSSSPSMSFQHVAHYGLHTTDDGALLDYELLQKAIGLKRILLVNFDTVIQPRLSPVEKKFLAEWKDLYNLLCLSEKLMVEYNYRITMEKRVANMKGKAKKKFFEAEKLAVRRSVLAPQASSHLGVHQNEEIRLRCIGQSRDPFSKNDLKLILSNLMTSKEEQRKELFDVICIH